MINNRCICW